VRFVELAAGLKTLGVTATNFVNREQEVAAVFDMMVENVLNVGVAQANTHPFNIAVAAQYLGTGKTNFALRFREQVTVLVNRGVIRPPSAEKKNAAVDRKAAFDRAFKFRSLYVSFSEPVLRPENMRAQPDEFEAWLVWAVASAAKRVAADFPGLRYRPGLTLAGLFEQLGEDPIFLALDEVDISEYFGDKGHHRLLQIIANGLANGPYLVYCAGVSPQLLLIGRTSSPSPVVRDTPAVPPCPVVRDTPAILKIHHVQFAAFQLPHIKTLLSQEEAFPSAQDIDVLAKHLLEWTSGVARLVRYGIEYLKESTAAGRPPTLERFVTFLLDSGRKKDVTTFRVPADRDVFLSLCEFGLWQIPLCKWDLFDFGQLGLEREKMHTIELVSHFGLYTSKHASQDVWALLLHCDMN
jgi:hypothetical protein